jgi:hypothetical protein
MVHLAATIPFGQPMSWEQFLEIPDDERAEYVDGKAFVSPPPGFAHQETCQRLRDGHGLKAQLAQAPSSPSASAGGSPANGRDCGYPTRWC